MCKTIGYIFGFIVCVAVFILAVNTDFQNGVFSDTEKIEMLEAENAKLYDDISIMKTQISNMRQDIQARNDELFERSEIIKRLRQELEDRSND